MDKFLELLQKSLKDDVSMDAITVGLAEYVEAKTVEKVPELIQNKTDILKEKKDIKAAFDTYKTKYAKFDELGITPETYDQTLVELEAFKANIGESVTDTKERERLMYEQGKDAKEAELRPQIDTFRKKSEMAETNASEYKDRLRIDKGHSQILTALQKMNVDYSDPFFKAGLLSSAQIAYNDNENTVDVMMQTDTGHIPLADWTNWYGNTPEGKKRIKAPVNTGDGAKGGLGGNRTGVKKTTKQHYAELFGDEE